MNAPCNRGVDAAGWVLGSLSARESEEFQEHLATCPECRRLVTNFRESAELLQEAAAEASPPPEVRERLMKTVRDEATPFRDSGQRVRSARRAPRPWIRLALPLAGAALFCLGAVGGLAVAPSNQVESPATRVFSGSVAGPAGRPQARAEVVVKDGQGVLVLHGMAAPPERRVYQVWLLGSESQPEPTSSLFSVPRTGETRVNLPALDGVKHVLVTAEPAQGSERPSTTPVVDVLVRN